MNMVLESHASKPEKKGEGQNYVQLEVGHIQLLEYEFVAVFNI